MNIRGLFDDGAMVNSLCKATYLSMKESLGSLLPSTCTLCMANGMIVPSTGKWVRDVHLGTQSSQSTFEVFPSRGGWSLLVGKPLLEQFRAVHNYGNDTICLPNDNGKDDILINSQPETLEDIAQPLQEDKKTPPAQTPLVNHAKPQQTEETNTAISTTIPPEGKRKGRCSKEKSRRTERNKTQGPSFWDVVWTVGETTLNTEGDLQPEVDVRGDNLLFMRQTNPFRLERIAEIIKQVKIGPDVSAEEQQQITAMLFADCFALSVREVFPIPGAEHRINIPPNATFPKRVPHQKPLSENQRAYLHNAMNELIAADIIERIRPEDVKCCSPITLT